MPSPVQAGAEGIAGVSDQRPYGRDRRAGRIPLGGNLLFVDPDDLLIEIIESGLSLSRPGWGVIATHHPVEALAVLSRHSELDAIITELVFERSADTGRAFIREAASRWPDIPIFVMTTLGPAEAGDLDTAEFITKPPDMDFLVRRIDRAIRLQRVSQVRGISLPTFLQIMEADRKTCTVIVSRGGRVGEVYFRGGRLVQARIEGIEGKEALFAMLSLSEHSLRVIDGCDVDGSLSQSLSSLLMEWSVREDHANHGGGSSLEENE